MQEKRKAEIVGIDELIKHSEKELKADTVAEGITPKQLEVDIRRLFEGGSAQLERTVKKEAPEKGGGRQQQLYLSIQDAHNYYSALQDIAYATLYLASPLADSITGHIINVDCGYLAKSMRE